MRAHVFLDVVAHIFDQLVRRQNAVAGVDIRIALPRLHQKISEHAEAGGKSAGLETGLALGGGRQGEEIARHVLQLRIHPFVGGLRRDLAGVAGVGEQDFPMGSSLCWPAHRPARHEVGGRVEFALRDIPRREIASLAIHQPMSGEVDHHAIRGLRDRRQPDLEFVTDVGGCRLASFQQVHVFRWKGSGLLADEHAINGLGVAFREIEILEGSRFLYLEIPMTSAYPRGTARGWLVSASSALQLQVPFLVWILTLGGLRRRQSQQQCRSASHLQSSYIVPETEPDVLTELVSVTVTDASALVLPE